MADFYKFKQGTREYQVMVDKDNAVAKWGDPDTRLKVSDFLGFKVDGINAGVYCDAERLSVWNLPENLQASFKKPEWKSGKLAYDCKKSSYLNKNWIKFCKENNLNTVGTYDWAWDLGWVMTRTCLVHRIDNDYYVEPKSGNFDEDEFLEPIDAATFYMLKAQQAKEKSDK